MPGMTNFNQQDAPNAKLAELFVTINGRRYLMLHAKNFEANADVQTEDVASVGNMISVPKATGLKITLKMTVYKCSEMFEDLVDTFKNTGVLPVFDVQTVNYDPATSMGRSSKIYNNCVLTGKVLLSMFDDAGKFIEQTIEAAASNYSRPQKYTNPSYI